MNPFRRVLLLSAVSGFIALSWEILWARFFNVASGSLAPAFGAMLGSYLLGLALGSLWSIKWQRADSRASWRFFTVLMLVANVLAFIVIPIASWLAVWIPSDLGLPSHEHGRIPLPAWIFSLPLVALASAVQGTLLPLLCHVGIAADSRAGSRLSFVYLANIVGSGLGSLLTGFLLLEWMTLASVARLLFAVACACIIAVGTQWHFLTATLVVWLAVHFAARPLHDGLWERLQYKNAYHEMPRFETIVESRHGVIAVDHNRKVYGSGAYDGEIGTALSPGNFHVRPYFVSAVHPGPIRDVLVIGMSAGPWTQIIASHPDQPKVDVVEISPAYFKIIEKYPQVSSILQNERITFHIDDGRRWLRRNPHRKFDVILMNTTHHWREFTSNLLSVEFLETCKAHLMPGGQMFWNCTFSPRAGKSGLTVFPHTLMCLNMCVGSSDPILPDKSRWERVLRAYRIDGQPLFTEAPESQASLTGVLALLDNERDEPAPDEPNRWWIMNRERMERLWGHAAPITDDNLGHEYFSGR